MIARREGLVLIGVIAMNMLRLFSVSKLFATRNPEDFFRTKPASRETGIPFFQRQIFTSFLLARTGICS